MLNLVDDPWIPVSGGGPRRRVGLADAFAAAHELVLDAAAPTQRAALLRLLVSVYTAARRPRRAELVADLRRGRFGDHVADYLARWRNRFELLDPERPFYQDPGTREMPLVPARSLVLSASSYGVGYGLLRHPHDGDETLSMADAAVGLLVLQGYDHCGKMRGGGSAAAGPLRGVALVTVRGRTLLETVVANTPVYDPAAGRPIPAGDDAPAWESEPIHGARAPRGWLDWLTWQSRRVALVASGDRVVGYRIAEGARAPRVLDPMVAYGTNHKTNEPYPMSMRASVSAWRDAAAMACGGSPPALLGQLAAVGDDLGMPGPVYDIEVLGVVGHQAGLASEVAAVVPVHRSVLADLDAAELVHAAVACADKLHADAKAAARAVFRDVDVDPDCWSALEPAFRRFAAAPSDSALEEFRHTARRTARRTLAAAVSPLGFVAYARVMTTFEPHVYEETMPSPLISYLQSLYDSDDRAALAALRATSVPERRLRAMRYVVAFVPSRGVSPARRVCEEDAAIDVAVLFAHTPGRGKTPLPLAAAASGKPGARSRFERLLEAPRAELAEHLRDCISMLDDVCFHDVHDALRRWDHPDQVVQRRWAVAFYSALGDSHR